MCVCYTYANLLIGIWHKTLTSLVPVDVIQNYSNQQLHFLHTNVTVAWRLVSCCSAMHVGVEEVCLRLALQAFFGQVLPRPWSPQWTSPSSHWSSRWRLCWPLKASLGKIELKSLSLGSPSFLQRSSKIVVTWVIELPSLAFWKFVRNFCLSNDSKHQLVGGSQFCTMKEYYVTGIFTPF